MGLIICSMAKPLGLEGGKVKGFLFFEPVEDLGAMWVSGTGEDDLINQRDASSRHTAYTSTLSPGYRYGPDSPICARPIHFPPLPPRTPLSDGTIMGLRESPTRNDTPH